MRVIYVLMLYDGRYGDFLKAEIPLIGTFRAEALNSK